MISFIVTSYLQILHCNNVQVCSDNMILSEFRQLIISHHVIRSSSVPLYPGQGKYTIILTTVSYSICCINMLNVTLTTSICYIHLHKCCVYLKPITCKIQKTNETLVLTQKAGKVSSALSSSYDVMPTWPLTVNSK